VIRLFLAFVPSTPPPKKKRKKQNKHHQQLETAAIVVVAAASKQTNQRCKDKLKINVPFATTSCVRT